MSGTSVASPVVAGAITLLMRYIEQHLSQIVATGYQSMKTFLIRMSQELYYQQQCMCDKPFVLLIALEVEFLS